MVMSLTLLKGLMKYTNPYMSLNCAVVCFLFNYCTLTSKYAQQLNRLLFALKYIECKNMSPLTTTMEHSCSKYRATIVILSAWWEVILVGSQILRHKWCFSIISKHYWKQITSYLENNQCIAAVSLKIDNCF